MTSLDGVRVVRTVLGDVPPKPRECREGVEPPAIPHEGEEGDELEAMLARNGDVVNTAPGANGPAALIAQGCRRPHDGGGGMFVWNGRSTAEDDGGTVLMPKPTDPATYGKPGRWHRLYSGSLDIRWFGAQGNRAFDGEAIFRAIAASAGSGPARGAEVFVPEGEFLAQVCLPRLGHRSRGLTIRGAGPRVSRIVWEPERDLPDDTRAVVYFEEPDPDNPAVDNAVDYRFASIQFRHRKAGGTAFRHLGIGDARLKYAVFEDVAFFSDGVHSDNTKNHPVAELRSAFNCRLDRVQIRGSAGLLIQGARNHLVDVHTNSDYDQSSGIVLENCGETSIDSPRIDGLEGTGDGIALINCQHVSIRNASFEGKGGQSAIRIDHCANVALDNCNIGADGREEAGLWITGESENVRLTGGRIDLTKDLGIKIDPKCRTIRCSDVVVPGSSLKAMSIPNPDPRAERPFSHVDATASDVKIHVLPWFNRQRWWSNEPTRAEEPPPVFRESRVEYERVLNERPPEFRFSSRREQRVYLMLERWAGLFVSKELLNGRLEARKLAVSPDAGWTVDGIMQGGYDESPAPASPGRRVALFLRGGGGVTIASGPPSQMRLRDGHGWTPTADAMLELVFDGDVWWEVTRSG